MPPESAPSPILIIGAGAFGLSTALHLYQTGYNSKDITVFEQDTCIPPRYSAANDLNKIVRAEYEDVFYTGLAIVSHPPLYFTLTALRGKVMY